MKLQKLVFILALILISLTANTATDFLPSINIQECQPLMQLNHTMQKSLQLSSEEMEIFREINRNYWMARKEILDTPEMIGQNTALLACWDNWRLILEKSFTETQIQQFMQWQSKVDLLGKAPLLK